MSNPMYALGEIFCLIFCCGKNLRQVDEENNERTRRDKFEKLKKSIREDYEKKKKNRKEKYEKMEKDYENICIEAQNIFTQEYEEYEREKKLSKFREYR